MKKIASLALASLLVVSNATTTFASEVEYVNSELYSTDSITNNYTAVSSVSKTTKDSANPSDCARIDTTNACSIESTIDPSVDYLDSYSYSVDVVAGQQYTLLVDAPLGGVVTLDSIVDSSTSTDISSFVTVLTDQEGQTYAFTIDTATEYLDAVTYNFTITTADDTDVSVVDGIYGYFVNTYFADATSYDVSGEIIEDKITTLSDMVNVNFKDIELTVEANDTTQVDDNNNFSADFVITNTGETSFYVLGLEIYAHYYSDKEFDYDDDFLIDGYDLDTYENMVLNGEVDAFISNGESITITVSGVLYDASATKLQRELGLSITAAQGASSEITSFTTASDSTGIIDYTYVTGDVTTETDTDTTAEITTDSSEGEILETGINPATSILAFAFVALLAVIRKVAIK